MGNSETNTTAEYTVQKGDTLYGIATRHGTTVDAIKEINSLKGILSNQGKN